MLTTHGPCRWQVLWTTSQKNGGPGNPEASKYKRELAWSLLQKHANCWDPGSLNLGATPVTAGSHLVYQIKIETVSGRQALR